MNFDVLEFQLTNSYILSIHTFAVDAVSFVYAVAAVDAVSTVNTLDAADAVAAIDAVDAGPDQPVLLAKQP